MFSLLIFSTWLLTVLSVAVCSCFIKYREKKKMQTNHKAMIITELLPLLTSSLYPELANNPQTNMLSTH